MRTLWWFLRAYWRHWSTWDERLAASLDRLAAAMREFATHAEYTARAMEEFAIAWEALERRIDQDIMDEYIADTRKRGVLA